MLAPRTDDDERIRRKWYRRQPSRPAYIFAFNECSIVCSAHHLRGVGHRVATAVGGDSPAPGSGDVSTAVLSGSATSGSVKSARAKTLQTLSSSSSPAPAAPASTPAVTAAERRVPADDDDDDYESYDDLLAVRRVAPPPPATATTTTSGRPRPRGGSGLSGSGRQ